MTRTRVVSPSEIDTYRQCPWKHEAAYKERWVGISSSPALDRGTRWHAVLEVHYLQLLSMQPGFGLTEDQKLERCAEAVAATLDVNDETDDLLWWMYQGHVDLYGADEQWKILGVEWKGEFWLPTTQGTRSSFKQKCKIDLIVKDLQIGGNWIVDHKSCKDLPKQKELDLDDQFGLYEWGLRSSGKPILGTVHSAGRTQRNKNQDRHPQLLEERFKRTRMSRTDVELETIAIEAYQHMRTAYGYVPGEAPRSPNPDTCRWRCDFTDACLMARKGVDRHEALRSFGFHQDFTRH